MTDNHHDYRHELLQDLAQHRAQQRSASVSCNISNAIPDLQPAPTRLYNRLNRSEPSVNLAPRPPDQPKPDHIYQQRAFYNRASQSQLHRSDQNESHEDSICSEAPFPANMLESYRNRDQERRVQAGLPPAKSQQRERYSQLQEQLRQRSGSLNSIAFEPCRTDPLQGLSELCENEQKLYDDVFRKVIENESNRCVESGQVLEEIRKSYHEMFVAVPHYIRKAQHNVNQTNTIVAQLEHQVQLNRDLEARMSQLESEQETLQLEREFWIQEKQTIMDDHNEFQNNFLQLRNFWEAERNRYEQQAKALKKSLQLRQPVASVESDPTQSALINKMSSFLSSAFDIVDSAPNLEKLERSNHQSSINSVDAANPAKQSSIDPLSSVSSPALDSVPDLDGGNLSDCESSSSIGNAAYSAEPTDDLSKTESAEHPFLLNSDSNKPEPEVPSVHSDTDLVSVADNATGNEMPGLPESAPNKSISEALNLPKPSIDSVSPDKDGRAGVNFSESISSLVLLEPALPEPEDDHTRDDSLSQSLGILPQEPTHKPERARVFFELKSPPKPALHVEKINHSEGIQTARTEGGFNQKYDAQERKVSNTHNPILDPSQTRRESDMISSRPSGPILIIPIDDGLPSKEYERPTELDSDKLAKEQSSRRSTLGSNQSAVKAELSLNFDKIRTEKEHRYDLNSIEYLGSPSLKQRSSMSSRLSISSNPGWNTSTPVPNQPVTLPKTPRFARRRPRLDLLIKSNLNSSLENLLKQARNHKQNDILMTEPNLLKLIDFVLDSCFAATIAKKEKQRRSQAIDLNLYIIGLMKEQHGLDQIVVTKWSEMMNSIRKYRPCNVFIDLIGDLLEGESDSHVKILLRIRQLLTKSRHGVSMLIQDHNYICQDRAVDVIKSLFSDFISSAAYQQTTALVTQACRPWAHIVHEYGSFDVIKKSQILSPRLNLNMMDVINPHDRRFNCNEYGIEVNRFIPLAYQGIRRAELEYERDQWARRVFHSVDHNNDHFISFDQFSRAFSSNTIPQLSNRQLQVLFEKTTQQAATKQMSLERFRHVCSQLRHLIFMKEDCSDEDDHLCPTVESIIGKWTRLDPAYNKFIELMCNTKSGFDICQRLSYARLVFEGALIYGAKSASIIEKYRLMLSIIAESQPDPTVFMSNATLMRDIDRLEKLVDLRLKALVGPGMVMAN